MTKSLAKFIMRSYVSFPLLFELNVYIKHFIFYRSCRSPLIDRQCVAELHHRLVFSDSDISINFRHGILTDYLIGAPNSLNPIECIVQIIFLYLQT